MSAQNPEKPGGPGVVTGSASSTVPHVAPPSSVEAAAPEAVAEDEPTSPRQDDRGPRADAGLSDFVRRAVSAGVGVAARSKDDIMRAAAGEMRNWLDHLNINEELAKVLAKLVVEVKTEIRFRPNADGKIVPEAVNDVKVKPGT
jgi:hypothetical protein